MVTSLNSFVSLSKKSDKLRITNYIGPINAILKSGKYLIYLLNIINTYIIF